MYLALPSAIKKSKKKHINKIGLYLKKEIND